jgi:hypothetical protein
MASNMVEPSLAGDFVIMTPTSVSALIFPSAPPFPPLMIAPACPIPLCVMEKKKKKKGNYDISSEKKKRPSDKPNEAKLVLREGEGLRDRGIEDERDTTARRGSQTSNKGDDGFLSGVSLQPCCCFFLSLSSNLSNQYDSCDRNLVYFMGIHPIILRSKWNIN